MTTHANGYFAIGSSHIVCQDYVRTGKTKDGRAYALLSDGCSSSADTDIGSRLLCLHAEKQIKRGWDFDPYSELGYALEEAQASAKDLGLDETALDATLLIAVETETHIEVFVIGDGVVAARRRDGGKPFILKSSYPMGAPFYLSYLLDPERLALFDALEGNALVTEGDRCENVKNILSFSLPKADFDLVILMSDGAESFRKAVTIPVSYTEIVEQMLKVQGAAGEFMVRRASKFLKSYCKAQDWTHYDDFSVAGLFLEAPEVVAPVVEEVAPQVEASP